MNAALDLSMAEYPPEWDLLPTNCKIGVFCDRE